MAAFDGIPRDICPIFLFLSTRDSYRFATASGESVDRVFARGIKMFILPVSQ